MLKELDVIRQRGVCCELPEVDSGWAQTTSALLKALSDPTRLRMFAALWKAEAAVCICDFTAGLDVNQPTISHHMGKLREAGLVESEKRGIWVYYRARHDLPAPTRELVSLLVG